jgi:hypothetical protein
LILSFQLGFLLDIHYQEASNLNEEINKMLKSLIYKRSGSTAEPLKTS